MMMGDAQPNATVGDFLPTNDPTRVILEFLNKVSPGLENLIPVSLVTPITKVANINVTPLLLGAAYLTYRVLR